MWHGNPATHESLRPYLLEETHELLECEHFRSAKLVGSASAPRQAECAGERFHHIDHADGCEAGAGACERQHSAAHSQQMGEAIGE